MRGAAGGRGADLRAFDPPKEPKERLLISRLTPQWNLPAMRRPNECESWSEVCHVETLRFLPCVEFSPCVEGFFETGGSETEAAAVEPPAAAVKRSPVDGSASMFLE